MNNINIVKQNLFRQRCSSSQHRRYKQKKIPLCFPTVREQNYIKKKKNYVHKEKRKIESNKDLMLNKNSIEVALIPRGRNIQDIIL